MQERVFNDGDKVKLKVEQIASRQDFVSKTSKYKEWLYANAEKVFTVHRVYPDELHSLIELEEDKTEPKWLWWDGDLERSK